jgi:hypothetical protein
MIVVSSLVRTRLDPISHPTKFGLDCQPRRKIAITRPIALAHPSFVPIHRHVRLVVAAGPRQPQSSLHSAAKLHFSTPPPQPTTALPREAAHRPGRMWIFQPGHLPPPAHVRNGSRLRPPEHGFRSDGWIHEFSLRSV